MIIVPKKLIRFILVLLILLLPINVRAEEELAVADPVEKIFDELYKAWNEHDANKLFSYYSKTFSTGDGISKEEYRKLTENLWVAYPDIKIENQKRTIRSQDQHAAISIIDFFYGESKDPNQDIQQKGTLNAISQGQLFLQKYGNEWKIESDRIHFELVTVYYGNAKQYLDSHLIFFSSPELVKADQQYSATLYFVLPENIKATATINRELIQPPAEEKQDDSFQVISDHKLERLFQANPNNRNELVSATIILSKGIIEPKLDGILYISKRVNVLPPFEASKPFDIVKVPFAKSKSGETSVKPQTEEENFEEPVLEE
jgi:hypothetical protein